MAEFRCIESFAPPGHRIINKGDVLSSDDPDYKGREHFFEPVGASAARRLAAVTTETASAAPGERRTRTRAKNEEKTGS